MSVANFLPNVWIARILANFHESSLANVIAELPDRVEGTKMIFNRIGAGAVKPYSGTVSWDDIDTTPIELAMDQKKYFAFALDDVDRVQSAGPGLIDANTQEHSSVMSETADAWLLGVLAAAVKANLTVGPLPISKSNAYDLIVDVNTMLTKKKVPLVARYTVVSPDILALLSKDDRFTKSPEVLANGVVNNAKIAGSTLVQSVNSAENTILVAYKPAIGFGTQLNEVEAMRLQSAFADGVRGLQVFGGGVLLEEGIAKILYSVIDAGYLLNLEVESVAGATSGKTAITIDPTCPSGYTLVYKTGATVAAPVYDADLSAWTAWDGSADITATTGHVIGIAFIDASSKCKAYGYATVASKA